MELDFKGQKVMVCGLQGSGKTTLAKKIVRNKKCIVYTPHPDEWKDMPDNIYIFVDRNFGSQLGKLIEKAKELGKQGLIEGVVIDEMDMVFRNNFDLNRMQEMNDLVINHRHYNLFLIGITRRPQDIPTKIFESSKYIISFALVGGNIRKKFNEIYEGLGDIIRELDYDSHEFVVYRIGHEPRVCSGDCEIVTE